MQIYNAILITNLFRLNINKIFNEMYFSCLPENFRDKLG
jgi:hypothetical protein